MYRKLNINYIKQLNEFYSTLDYKPLSSNAISLYCFLLHIANKTGWLNEFKVANSVLMSKCKLNSSALQRARMELINNNYITYKKGSNQNEMPKYSIVILYYEQFEQADGQADEQAGEQASEQANEQADEQANEHNNKIKLNKIILDELYNFLSEAGPNVQFEKINDTQKRGIVLLLEKLGVYIEPGTNLKAIPKEVLLDTKIIYWVIKELYFSPYNIYLNNIERKTFMNKYMLSKKYIGLNYADDQSITQLINYLIVTIRKELSSNVR